MGQCRKGTAPALAVGALCWRCRLTTGAVLIRLTGDVEFGCCLPRRIILEIEIEIGTPERTRAWTLGAVGWASRMLSARIRMRPPYAPLPLPGDHLGLVQEMDGDNNSATVEN